MSDPVSDQGAGFRPTRRIVFHGLGALGVAVALAGCAAGGSGEVEAPDAGTALATTSEVPVGGGIILADQKIVVTQPTAGDFKAFSAVCTHQGTLLARVENGEIECDLHGSTFSAATGEATGAPATAALAEVPIVVDGDAILAA